MPSYVLHSVNLRQRLGEYAKQIAIENEALLAAYERLVERKEIVEKPSGRDDLRTYISYVDIEPRLEDTVERSLYAALRKEVGITFAPSKKFSSAMLRDRILRVWEQLYNIFVNKIPLHWVRVAWLRAGGMKIGKGSSVWRNTEIVGIENIVIGDDSVVGWHGQLDGRGGLIIGNHCSIGSYVLIIAGGHDPLSEDFSSFGEKMVIEDYAWIATRAMLLDGARIGKGAVVAAGTIVAKPIAPFKVVGGFSAKPIADRPQNIGYGKVGGRSLYNFMH